MNVNEFKNKYVPLVGTEVIDSVFNCPLTSSSKHNGLTKVKLQTELVKRFYLKPYQIALLKNDINSLLKLIDEMIDNICYIKFIIYV